LTDSGFFISRKWSHRPFAGIALMLLGIALYACSDACIKYLIGCYSVHQTTFLRALSRLIPLLCLLFFQKNIGHVFRTNQKLRHAIRLAINLGYTYTFMLSFSLTSLTNVYTISYTSSFFIILLGALFLKEKVSKEKWIAVAIGMVGICIALQPGLDLFQKGGWIVLIGTSLGALNKVYMRRLAKTEHTLAITIYPNLLMLFVSAPFLFSRWIPLPWQDIGLFALVGALTAAGQYSVAQALRYAKASSLAPIDYSSFVWVILLDFSFFSLIPHLYTLIGTSIIIASNVYLVHITSKEEKKQKKIVEDSNKLSAP